MAAPKDFQASRPLSDLPLVSHQLVNVHQAKTQLSQLLQQVEQGQEVVIARSGVPIARLVAWQAPVQAVAAPGAMHGQIKLADDFDAPLDGLFEALP
jgi:antitoxin (DNA-binding transcriptional repressor) of toxin-antitoxin stability system